MACEKSGLAPQFIAGSFRPKAQLCRAEAEESIEIASPKANQKEGRVRYFAPL